MKKLEKIARQEQKTRDKIVALQAILKQIDGVRTEQENLQIIQQVRALKLSREELYAFIGGGELPAMLAGAIGGADTTEQDGSRLQETIYSRPDRKRKNKPSTEPSEETQENNDNGDTEPPNFESEGMNHEEQ